MTNRQRILQVLERKASGFPPVALRLDLWFNHARASGVLPAEVAGMTCAEIEDHLGFCRSARFRNYIDINSQVHPKSVSKSDGDSATTYHFGDKTLVSTTRLTPDMSLTGMRPLHAKHPVETESDYRLMADFYDSATARFDDDGLAAFDRETGDKGLPMLILGPCPFHELMLNLVGYDKFYFDYYDIPAAVDRLFSAMDAFYRKTIWPAVAASTPTLILHGCHFSHDMTPLPLFKKYFVPYHTDFCRLMHAHGKFVGFHCDDSLGELAPLIPQVGFDVADCLATAPLVDETLDDYFEAWQGKVVCWGGLPSTIFSPEYLMDDYMRYVDEVIRKTRNRGDFIFGASDNVMPGSQWEKLKHLSERQ